MADAGWISPTTRALIERTIEAAERDQRIVALTLGGSAAVGEIDEFSDLDFVVVCRDDD